jgi:hypothetical protein
MNSRLGSQAGLLFAKRRSYELMPSDSAKIEITRPRLFTAGAVAVVNAYGLLMITPIFSAIIAVSVIKLSVLTVLIPLLALAATVFLLPFGLGNTHVARLVRSLKPGVGQNEDGFIIQLTVTPRLRSGLRALLEDADDIGYLTFGCRALCFQGDSVKLSVPWEDIQLVRPRNIGWRGLFVYGRRIRLVVSGWPEVESFEIAERSSWLLPASRIITRKLYEQFLASVPPKTQ